MAVSFVERAAHAGRRIEALPDGRDDERKDFVQGLGRPEARVEPVQGLEPFQFLLEREGFRTVVEARQGHVGCGFLKFPERGGVAAGAGFEQGEALTHGGPGLLAQGFDIRIIQPEPGGMGAQVFVERGGRVVRAAENPVAHGVGKTDDRDEMDDGPVAEQGARGQMVEPDRLAQLPGERPAFRHPFAHEGMVDIEGVPFETVHSGGLSGFQEGAVLLRHGRDKGQASNVMEQAGHIGLVGGDQPGVGSGFRGTGGAGQGVVQMTFEVGLARLERQAGQGDAQNGAAEPFQPHGFHGLPEQDGFGGRVVRAGRVGHPQQTTRQGRIGREEGAGGVHVGRGVKQHGQGPPRDLHGGRQMVDARNEVS